MRDYQAVVYHVFGTKQDDEYFYQEYHDQIS